MKHEIIPVSPELLALIGTEGINALGLPKWETFLLDIVVAGTTFCPVVQELYPMLLPDTVLRMVCQSHSKHDEHAIAIHYEEHRIGYILQELSLVISRLMDAGKEFYARVVQVKKINGWIRIPAQLFMIEQRNARMCNPLDATQRVTVVGMHGSCVRYVKGYSACGFNGDGHPLTRYSPCVPTAVIHSSDPYAPTSTTVSSGST